MSSTPSFNILYPVRGFFIGAPMYDQSPSEDNLRSGLVAVGDINWSISPPENPDLVLVPRAHLHFFPGGKVAAHVDGFVAWKMAGDEGWTLRNHSHVEYLYARVLDEFSDAETGGFASFLHLEVVEGSTRVPGDVLVTHISNVHFEKSGYAYVRLVKDPANYTDPIEAFRNYYVADDVLPV